MGYYTDFDGHFTITPPLQDRHEAYLQVWLPMEHRAYYEDKLKDIPDPLREAVGLPIGPEGVYATCVESPDEHWTKDGIVLEPRTIGEREELRHLTPDTAAWCPTRYCYWTVESDDTGRCELQAPQSGKVYSYQEWLLFLLKKFFVPWGYTLNGQVNWNGEDRTDMGVMRIEDNVLSVDVASVTYETQYTWAPDEEK